MSAVAFLCLICLYRTKCLHLKGPVIMSLQMFDRDNRLLYLCVWYEILLHTFSDFLTIVIFMKETY